MSQQFYALTCGVDAATESVLELEFSSTLWRPTRGQLAPRGLSLFPFAVWSGLYYARVLANRDYAILLVRAGAHIVHRSCVFPGYFRFPFMEPDDLQVGDTWTAPSCRGRGLAKYALSEVIRRLGRPKRRFWYLVDSDNLSSIRVAEHVGFRCIGEGRRTHRYGLRILGSFELEKAAA